MITYEEARANLETLAAYYDANKQIRNEDTTRLHLIDELLFNVLAWDRQTECVTEESHDREYADYTFLAPRRILIVEAKREGDYFEVPAGGTHLIYKLQSLCRDNENLTKAIKQAMTYCQTRGAPFGAVINGHQIVAFIAVRSDGVPPMEGRALVFQSFSFMLVNFLKLWQSLSKPGIEEKHLQTELISDAIAQLPPKLAANIWGYPGLKNRNVFQADLQIVSELVIEDVAKDKELEDIFLKDCYCESGALSQHSLLSKNIIEARYSSLFDASGGPTLTAAKTKRGISSDLLANSLSRRPILLIGDVGVGKTMFITHLVRVDARAAFQNVLDFYLDLGSSATLSISLRDYVLHEISRQLEARHQFDPDDGSIVRAVYHVELARFAKGIYGPLKLSDPIGFQQKEIDYLQSRIAERDQHLKAVLTNLSKSRKKQIIIFIDNCDQRGYEIQQEAFLVAQELSANWPVIVFVSLRPETFHISLKEGALTGYHPKAFTIAPPRVNIVLEKRLEFALRITSGEVAITSLSISLTATFSSLQAIIEVFLHTLRNQPWMRECLDNISGGNVRHALDLVKQFFGSGHVDTQKIVDIYMAECRYDIPLHEFLRAVIYGDSQEYNPEQSPIANLFDVTFSDPREHFVLPILLSLITNPSSGNEGFVETSRVYEQIQGLGFVPDQIDAALVRGYRFKLVETTARRAPGTDRQLPSSIRLTTIGAYHTQVLAGLFTYIDAMIVDTPIFDGTARNFIKDVRGIYDRSERARVFKAYLDQQWQAFDGLEAWFPWPRLSLAIGEEIRSIQDRVLRTRRL